MNPLPMILSDLRSLRWLGWAISLLVALAVAIGVGLGAQERMLRASSARAADDFDLVIGAPGSATQLVLTTVYLDLEALPLVDGSLLDALARDPRVAAFAPVAIGDVVKGFPVVGTTAAFASRWGGVQPSQGRVFERAGEAMVGAEVDLQLGEAITPSHAVAGRRGPFGLGDAEEEARHRHEGVHYTVVGRLPRLGSPWDRAILVPIESVWETHHLGNGHSGAEAAAIGPPFDAAAVPGVPAIVVKPRRVSDAYALRGDYRRGLTMALFPAEVLVQLYRNIGDLRDILVAASAFNNLLIFVATLLLLVTLTGLRRRRYAVLRALGAPALYVASVVWAQAAILLGLGCLVGLPLGWGAAWLVSQWFERQTGLHLAFAPGLADAALVMALLAAGSLLAVVPALLSYRLPVSEGLQG